MKCCKLLTGEPDERLPFERAIATGYYDGPTEGFTECSQCGQAYSFRKLDWDELQDVRVFAFAPIPLKLDDISKRLLVDSGNPKAIILVPPLAEPESEFVRELLAVHPTRVTAFEGWPGHSSLWRDVAGLNFTSISDWFSFLGIPRKRA